MKSIQARFILLILAAILLSVAVVGGIALATAVSRADQDSASIIGLTCENEALYINSTFSDIEGAVDIEVSYAVSRIESVSRFLGDEAYRSAYTDEVERLFLDVANGTEGAVSFYFRYNAETVDSTQGFLYTRDAPEDEFSEIELTDLSLYDPDDDEHVGWYYIPLRKGEATWLEPYQNKNLGIYMISYVVPVFVDGEFIGVVGMDVNFQVIIDQLQTIRPYESGYAFLLNQDGTVLFHPEVAYGTRLEDVAHVGGRAFSEALSDGSGEGDLVRFTSGGVDKELAFQELRNGMLLAIVANVSDIDAGRNELVFRVSLAALVIAALFIVVALMVGRHALRPLNELTEGARQVAAGNLDVTIPEARASEVKTLIDAYRVTVERMREQMSFIDELAHHDALTQLWNKSAYDESVERLDAAVAAGDARFAIVMVDVNDLKLVNDTYGHERGDDYLRNAVESICEAFGDRSVYRIGGDEFTVILEGDEVERLDERLAALERDGEGPFASGDEAPWKHASLAFGCACFDAAADRSAADVFKRADAAMYAKKQQMKGQG